MLRAYPVKKGGAGSPWSTMSRSDTRRRCDGAGCVGPRPRVETSHTAAGGEALVLQTCLYASFMLRLHDIVQSEWRLRGLVACFAAKVEIPMSSVWNIVALY